MKRILSTAGWLVMAAVLTMGTAACSTNDDNALPEPSVTAQARTIDLATLTADFTFVNGDVLTGTLDGTTQKLKLTIADGATVTLSDAAINGVHYGGSSDTECLWAGLTCLGDATIVLADGTTNTVKNFNRKYPCIYAAEGKTLVIKGGPEGTGRLIVNNKNLGAGIGGGDFINCGNIEIQGGTITAQGGFDGAGIGSGYYGGCGNITISGGIVTATGDHESAGIGCGTQGSCGNISITGGTVTATGGGNGAGIGCGGQGSCGDISITGGTVTAKGGDNAAGIGCGYSGDWDYPSVCGSINISSGIVSVVAIKGDNAFRPIGASTFHYVFNKCGQIYFDDNEIISDIEQYNQASKYDYDPEDGFYGALLFVKTTQILGDKNQQPGDEDIYYNNTWTLTPY